MEEFDLDYNLDGHCFGVHKRMWKEFTYTYLMAVAVDGGCGTKVPQPLLLYDTCLSWLLQLMAVVVHR